MYIASRPELREYLRLQPFWYRKLSRDPQTVTVLEQEVNEYYGRTLPQRVEKFHNQLNLALMVMELLRSSGQSHTNTTTN